MRQFSIAKLLLSLLIIVCLTVAIWSGYVLFTHQTNPVWGTVIFLVAIGVLIWNIHILRSRHYRWKKPSFKLVFFSLLGVFLVCAFAGIQPLASYKDNAVGMVKEGIVKLTDMAGTEPAETKAPDELDKSPVVAPRGLYKCTSDIALLSEAWVNFKNNNILEMFNSWDGKNVFSYEFLDEMTKIKVHSLTGKVEGRFAGFTASFEYIKDYECVIIDGVKYFK